MQADDEISNGSIPEVNRQPILIPDANTMGVSNSTIMKIMSIEVSHHRITLE